MFVFIERFWEFAKTIITIAGPVIILIFILALLAGLVKWTDRTKDWLYQIGQNPILIVVWIGLSIVAIYFFYKYIPQIIKVVIYLV